MTGRAFTVAAVEDATLAWFEAMGWWVERTIHRRGIIEAWGRDTLKIACLMQERGLEPPFGSVRDGAVVNSVDLPTGKATSIMPTLRVFGPWIGPRWPDGISVGPLLSTTIRGCLR